MTDTTTNKRRLTSKQLRHRWGDVSHMFLERRLKKDPAFPRPIKIGSSRIRLWDEAEIEAYERQCARAVQPEQEVTEPNRRRRVRLTREAANAR